MLLDLVLFILLVEMLFISFVELFLQWNLWKPTLKHYITTGDKNIFLVYNYSIWSMIQRGSDKVLPTYGVFSYIYNHYYIILRMHKNILRMLYTNL
jgi:hypothetical protein